MLQVDLVVSTRHLLLGAKVKIALLMLET